MVKRVGPQVPKLNYGPPHLLWTKGKHYLFLQTCRGVYPYRRFYKRKKNILKLKQK